MNNLDSITNSTTVVSLFDISLRVTLTKCYFCGTWAHSISYDTSLLQDPSFYYDLATFLPRIHSPNSQCLILLYNRPMGMFQPAVLSTAVWQDILPSKLSQLIAGADFFTTATAKYPTRTQKERGQHFWSLQSVCSHQRAASP